MTSPAPIDVWIDTDPAIGVPRADVDDGLALIQAFHSPELSIRGVSTVFGNAPAETTYPTGCEVVRRFGPPGLAVHAGAASAEPERSFDEASDAVRALAAALEQAPLVILAIGPVSNVANLLRLRPDLAPRIQEIVMVAARRPGQEFRSIPQQPIAFPDMNFECDPEGMQVLLDSEVDLVFAPWEVSSHVWLEAVDLDALAGVSETGTYIAEHSRDWLAMWTDDLKAPGFNPFDTLAIAWVTHRELLTHHMVSVWIEPPTGNAVDAKPQLLVDLSPREAGRKAIYCSEPSRGFKPLLLERLAGPG